MTSTRIWVQVAYATPESQVVIDLEIGEGASIADAIDQSGIRIHFPDAEPESMRVGVWGKARNRDYSDHKLRHGDRIEIYRDLVADPKNARRARALKEGKR